MSEDQKLILGSSSKWRRALFRDFGVGEFDTDSPDIDEKAIRDPDPARLVELIADGKLDKMIEMRGAEPNSVIVCSDQVIWCEDAVREKPVDEAECRKFLDSYSRGEPAKCYVGVAVYNTRTKERAVAHDVASQFFKPLPKEAVDKLIEQGDVLQTAGGFCVEHMTEYELKREGEIETVQGLPRALTLKMLKDIGLERLQDSETN